MKTVRAISMIAAAMVLLAFNVPAYASTTDDRIESSAKESYVFKTYLQADDIKIKSTDGVVVLKGTVAEESHKALARETVAGLPGVKTVDDQLEVKGERPAETSDAWLMMKVKSTLLFHRSVSGFKTEVAVKDGIVTLQGTAANQAQKDLATEYARDIEGVKDVINQMAVAVSSEKERTVGDKIDDASITGQVKVTLLYHRSTSGIHTAVNTMDGVVTLSGRAKTAAERDLASKLAGDVHGVKSVHNIMTVE